MNLLLDTVASLSKFLLVRNLFCKWEKMNIIVITYK